VLLLGILKIKWCGKLIAKKELKYMVCKLILTIIIAIASLSMLARQVFETSYINVAKTILSVVLLFSIAKIWRGK
jgi:hypothetical protein